MKKLLAFCALAFIMATATFAAPTYSDVGQERVNASLVQLDAQEMTVDFVFIHDDDVVYTIATTVEMEYTIYEAMPMEMKLQVFNFTLPVFRLCNSKVKTFKSYMYKKQGLNSSPENKYYMA